MVHKFYSADLHGFVHRFLQDLVNEMTEISAEDKLFLTIIEHKEKKVINGHCQFPLPLRNLDITIPNNKSMAEKKFSFWNGDWSETPNFMKIRKSYGRLNLKRTRATVASKTTIRRKILPDTTLWYLGYLPSNQISKNQSGYCPQAKWLQSNVLEVDTQYQVFEIILVNAITVDTDLLRRLEKESLVYEGRWSNKSW